MSYSVVRADLVANKRDILRIWARSFLATSDNASTYEDRFSWYYRNNPDGPGQCWLLRDSRSGRFIGTAGLGLRKIKVVDQLVQAGLLVDFAVDKEHRSFLPALLLQKEVRKAVERNLGLIYCAPNSQATAVLLRAGYVKLGMMVRYARVLNAAPYVRRVMRDIPGAGALAQPLNWALKVSARHTWRVLADEYVARELDSFDPRFEALWERASPDFPVIGERTPRFLHWRYACFPLCRHFIFGLLGRDEKKLFGYIVYCFERNTVSIVDLFFVNSDEVLASLLSEFLRFASMKNAVSVSLSFMGSGKIRKTLNQFGFRQRSDTRTLVAFVREERPLASAVLDQSNWYLVGGDGDNA